MWRPGIPEAAAFEKWRHLANLCPDAPVSEVTRLPGTGQAASMADASAEDGVVVWVDPSEHSERAVRWAAEQADLEHRRLLVVATASGADADRVAASARRVAEDAAALANATSPWLEVSTVVAGRDPRATLVGLSEEARVIVLGSRGAGDLTTMLAGSVAADVGRLASCPVLLTRAAPPPEQARGVLVGADGTPASLPVLEFAFDQAALRRTPVTVAHRLWELVATTTGVHPEDPAELRCSAGEVDKRALVLAEMVADLCEAYPDVAVNLREAAGFAQEISAGRSEGWELLVAGRRAVGATRPLDTDTVALGVLEHAHLPVALVPQAATF